MMTVVNVRKMGVNVKQPRMTVVMGMLDRRIARNLMIMGMMVIMRMAVIVIKFLVLM